MMSILRSLPMDIPHLSDTAQAIVLAGAALAVVAGWWRWIRPRWKTLRARFTAAVDSLVGRPAVVDSITGKELAPAIPGIGVRQDRTEQAVELLTETVSRIADQDTAIAELRAATAQNARDIALLQAGLVERVASKVEQTEMWKAVQRIQDDEPPMDGDVPEPGE